MTPSRVLGCASLAPAVQAVASEPSSFRFFTLHESKDSGEHRRVLRLLNTSQTFSKLIHLIECATREVWLVSPYIRLDEEDRAIRDANRRAVERGVRLNVVLRLDAGRTQDPTAFREGLAELRKKKGLTLHLVAGVHVKLYWSDAGVLITSANLLSTSYSGGVVEVGQWSEAPGDIEAARSFYEREIAPRVVTERDAIALADGSAELEPRTFRVTTASTGRCIRCRTAMPFDRKRPYCGEHFAVWSRFGNEEYVDRWCHQCGEAYSATKRRPVCSSCFVVG